MVCSTSQVIQLVTLSSSELMTSWGGGFVVVVDTTLPLVTPGLDHYDKNSFRTTIRTTSRTTIRTTSRTIICC